jgi:amino acid adenylation domain-containing protein
MTLTLSDLRQPKAQEMVCFPASFAQQRLWFVDQFTPGRATYNLPSALRVRGKLNLEVLKRTVEEIVQRHETLRTRFVAVGGEPQQVIEDRVNIELAVLDLSSVAGEEEREAEAMRLAREEAQQPFDLKQAPLFRGKLLRLGELDHVLLFTMHHIISDAWSMGVLVEEVSVLYGAFSAGQPSPLPDLPIQYADYTVWQREWLEGGVLEQQLAYWKQQLGGSSMLLLPTDRPRPTLQSQNGATCEFVIGASLTQKLKKLADGQGATLFMVLVAAFQTLLYRYSGQDDIAVGTPTAGRSSGETENLIGFFINTLVLRGDLSGGPSFIELLQRTKEVTLEAYAHEDVPFEKLVEALSPERNLGSTPLFQVMVVLQNAPESDLRLGAATLQPFNIVDNGTSKFDLLLQLGEDGFGKLNGSLQYNTDLFVAATVGRMIEHYRRLLSGIADKPTQSIDVLPLLTTSERKQVIEGWNKTAVEFPRRQCLPSLIEEQVARTPDAIAVEHQGRNLTYREFNERANQLAWRLRELGVAAETRVGLMVERSVEMVVGLLAVLKAGAAYVPLDPDYPPERLSYMLESSQVKVLLTQQRLREQLPPYGGQVLELDGVEERSRIGEQKGMNLNVPLEPENLAYLIYTSGSTGRPKGVMNTHGGLLNRLLWMQEEYRLEPGDVVLQKTPFSFDVSVWEFFWPLMEGAKLVVARPGGHQDPDYLATLINEQQITTLHFVPSMLAVFLNEERPKQCKSLRRVVCSGEALPLGLACRCLASMPWAELHNLYGPTEAAIDVTYWKCLAEDTRASVPIGMPIANMRVYVVDKGMEAAPAGVPGELCLAGVGLARGYWGRGDLTAERFVPDGLSGRRGERLYRTGDLVRWLADGNLEYLGRIDQQVKIRGHRIELGEIEAALEGHEAVKQAVVIVREDQPGEKRLVGYVVPSGGDEIGLGPAESLNQHALLMHLRAALPEYMVPAAVVELTELPLLQNGKLDRRALPQPGQDTLTRVGYEAPQGEVETQLAALWAEVLKIERVGRHDNFFELGGHSLLAVILIERLRRHGFKVDVRALFATPTVAELAMTMDGGTPVIEVPPNGIPSGCKRITPDMLPLIALTEEEIEHVVAAVPGGAGNVQDIYPLAPLQEGILFHHRLGGEGDPYLLAMQLAFDTRARLENYLRALQAIVDRHDILRTSMLWEGLAAPVQIVWRQALLPAEEIELDVAAGDVSEQLYERFHPRHFRIDVRQAPMLRLYIAHDSTHDRWLLMLLMHHLAGDHTTLEAIQAEIQAQLLGQQDMLPAPLPFRNLVAQARLGVSEAEHEAYFQQMLGDVEEPTAPFGLLDVQGDGSGIEEAHLLVEESLAGRLRAHARKLGVSTASLCHLAWAQVLARLCGREDVVFGTVLFGRMQGGEGADRVLGPFINTLPVRISVAEGVEASVRRVHSLLSDLLSHEHASLALAQRCCAVPAPLPLFSTMLNYRHSPGVGEARSQEAQRAWEGIEVLRAEERTNYPLTLSVSDLGQSLSLDAESPAAIGPLRICQYMHTGLEGLAEALDQDPGRAVSDLNILPPVERREVVYEWNDTARDYPQERCIHELFEEHVRKTPQALAIFHEGQQLTYENLNHRANQLAHYLREQGIKPEMLVGICLERLPEMLVGILGILKAGAAYVPMDPAYPEERLRFMQQNAGVAIMLTQQNHRAKMHGDIRVVYLEQDWQQIATCSPDNPVPVATLDNLAYMIYTSGSTGVPKGVIVEHRQVLNQFLWCVDVLGVNSHDRILQKASITFDTSIMETLLPLFAGAAIIWAGPGGERDPDYLAKLIPEQGVTFMDVVPAWLDTVLDYSNSNTWSSVRAVSVGGEALSLPLARKFQEKSQAPLWNCYGPTETTVQSTAWLCDLGQGKVLIGRPIANTQAYVVDKGMNPVPVGVPGELCLGGAGLARGYSGQGDLTAERFVPDGLSGRMGERIYRTGDLVRWLQDGNLEYLGRLDRQVKVRGFRIELGEIEAALLDYSGVGQALVTVREDRVGDKRLVAYIVAGPEVAATSNGNGSGRAGLRISELREHLLGRLPEYMVPSAFMQLEKLPLNSHGKIDREKLLGPDEEMSEHEYVAPRKPTEETLCRLWQEVLQRERVGIHDNFFKTGGHSLRAAQVAARMRETFKVEIPLRRMFESPTIAQLAEVIDQMVQASGVNSVPSQLLPDIKRSARKAAVLPMEPIGRG